LQVLLPLWFVLVAIGFVIAVAVAALSNHSRQKPDQCLIQGFIQNAEA